MAEKLFFDSGMLELDVNGNGLLRFNASDPNVYGRFYEFAKELPTLEQEHEAKAATRRAAAMGSPDDALDRAGSVLDELQELDLEIKRRLSRVFGEGNDFNALLAGVSLMAFGSNGERAITNLLNALKPYIEAGVVLHTKAAASLAVQEAQLNRAQRRAAQ